MDKIQFNEFEYLSILKQSEYLTTVCEFSKDDQFIFGRINKKVVLIIISKLISVMISQILLIQKQTLFGSKQFLKGSKINFIYKIFYFNKTYFQIIGFNFNISFPILKNNQKYNTIQSVSFDQDQKRLLVVLKSDIYFLDINSGNIIRVISDLKSIKDAQTFCNNQFLYTKQNGFSETQYCVKIWRLQKEPILIDYFSLKQEQVYYSEDEKYLSFVLKDSIKIYPIYPIQTESELRFIHFQQLSQVKISNINSQYILYGNKNNSIFTNFKLNEVIQEFSSYYTFEFSSDNQNIIFVGDGKCVLYNINDKMENDLLYFDEKSSFFNDNKILVLEIKFIMLYNIEVYQNLNLLEQFKMQNQGLIQQFHLNILQLQQIEIKL